MMTLDSPVSDTVSSLFGDARIVIYDCIVFIKQATFVLFQNLFNSTVVWNRILWKTVSVSAAGGSMGLTYVFKLLFWEK
jgi:hypothetical protein